MFTPDPTGIEVRVAASQGRRYFACAAFFLLGALLVYSALNQPPAPLGLVFLLALGTTALWLGEMLRRATQIALVLTDVDLRDTSGFVVARIDQISHVDRGALALKPANGFTLVLKSRQPRAWVPGMWWRVGRRVGVGGVVAAGQAKFMAEEIAQRLQRRDA